MNLETNKTYEDFPAEDLYTYAAIDCIVTSELLVKTFPRIIDEPVYIESKSSKLKKIVLPSILESIENIKMPAHEFICDLEINGIKYDITGNQQIKTRMEVEVAGLEDEIFKGIGRQIDLNSGDVVSEYLYGELKLTPPSLTKTGEASTDGDALKELAISSGIPHLGFMAKRNDIASVYRTFIKNYVRDFVKKDGRIHPSYNLHGTSSFRITGEKPNLTQLARPKHGYNIRDLYEVDEGNVFISLDFSSAEVKVLGALCKDKNLLKAIEEGLDFHSFSASKMRNIAYDEFLHALEDKTHPNYKNYKLYRQEAKVLTFSILYGSSVQGIARQMDISTSDAQNLMELYFKLYPGIQEFVEDSHLMAVYNHFVVTPFGQRKQEFGTMDIFKKSAVYNASKRNAQNVRVQSTTSTLGLFCFTKVNEAIKRFGAKSLCTVYDSIEIEAPRAKAAQVLETAFYYMNDYPVEVFDWLDLPIGVEAEIGYTWGTQQVVKRGVTQQELELIL